MDGVDGGEIVLIDSRGCPTDPSIMGTVSTVPGQKGKALQAPFEAFKFPTSEIVQFQALITPCLPHCAPVNCSVLADPSAGGEFETQSYGRRRRRSSPNQESGEQLLVINQLKISDPFERNVEKEKEDGNEGIPRQASVPGSCININALFFIGFLFTAIQVVMIGGWFCLWRRRSNSKEKELESSYAFGPHPPARHAHAPFPQKFGRRDMPGFPRL